LDSAYVCTFWVTIFPNPESNNWVKDKVIEIAPLAYMRGEPLTTVFVVADEMQNTTPNQMKMLLTRIGEGSKIGGHGATRSSAISRTA